MQNIYERILAGHGRIEDLALLEDIGTGISPGAYPGAGAQPGDPAIPFPPKQTTICVLGPSAVAPVTSSLRRFRHEYEAYINGTQAPTIGAGR
jgi:NADH-quinone oxidoreductase subunit F